MDVKSKCILILVAGLVTLTSGDAIRTNPEELSADKIMDDGPDRISLPITLKIYQIFH